jgi:hypothetical protein
MLVAIAVCALSAIFFAFPAGTLSNAVGLDARALQHLGQIPGVLLITHVIAGGAFLRRKDEPVDAGPARRPGRVAGDAGRSLLSWRSRAPAGPDR